MLATSPPPVPATALLGRSAEVAAVRALLAAPATRLVTLTGPPGVGKTRLAVAVAHDHPSVAWVDLAPVQDVRLVSAEIARALGVPAAAHIAAAVDRDVLLVVDNCEHLPDAMPGLGSLLAAASHLQILATSRERLRLAAEREYAVPPLPMPSDADVEDWSRLRGNPAIAVLLDRAPAHVDLTRDSARALADVCIRLDGLPLAIELAAARLRVFSPAELAFRLEHRMPLLTGGPRDAPARHRDLRTAIAWSHELLSDRDRAVFRRLAVFPGEWTLAAASAVCAEPDVLDAVESLLDKSLIRRVGDRFAMLMSLREYAAEQLVEHGEARATRDRHAAYFAALAQEWEQTVGSGSENATWAAMGRARADLRVAFEHSRAGTDVDATLWLAVTIGWYRYTRGTVSAALPIRDMIHAGLRDGRGSADARTAALLVSGVIAYALGDHDDAERELQEVSAVTGQQGDERRYATAHAFLGHVARERGEFELAAGFYARTREIYARLDNKRGVAWAAHDLGLLSLEQGDLGAAENLLREGLGLFEALDYEWATAVCSWALATVLIRRGQLDEAGRLLDDALRLQHILEDRRGLAQCLEAIAELAFRRGATATAARLLGAAQVQRQATAVQPTDAERARVQAFEAELTATLGAAQADHDRQAGRTMSQQAVRELATRIARPASAGAGPTVELTARQREVAALVAAGRTNRQIGRALGISEKTAEVHVHNIMARLNAPSRAGIAAWVVARDLQPSP